MARQGVLTYLRNSVIPTATIRMPLNELFYESYPSRDLAQAAAERFETFAIEQKLECNTYVGTVSTSVEEYQRGC